MCVIFRTFTGRRFKHAYKYKDSYLTSISQRSTITRLKYETEIEFKSTNLFVFVSFILAKSS